MLALGKCLACLEFMREFLWIGVGFIILFKGFYLTLDRDRTSVVSVPCAAPHRASSGVFFTAGMCRSADGSEKAAGQF